MVIFLLSTEGLESDVPKGHMVATSTAFANRLPHIYKDHESYDPGRFTPGREEDKAGGTFSYVSVVAGTVASASP
jgi:sterol 14-demethylase